MISPGTALWFARHESRLAWRDWLAMMTAGRPERRRTVAIGIAGFIVFMHAVAYAVVGDFGAARPDAAMLIKIGTTLALSGLLMVSQAMESMTRAFYARADLDLILASPAAAHKVFALRIATIALSVAAMTLLLAAPFIDVLVVRGGARWLGAYVMIFVMGAAATALAVALTVALFHVIGPKRTRLVAQVLAALIGAAFVIGLQVAAILSSGTLSRSGVEASGALTAHAGYAASLAWWPARAVLGDGCALAGMLGLSLLLLAGAMALIAPRFADYAVAAAGAGAAAAPPVRPGRRRSALAGYGAPHVALRRKEWILLRRDPWLLSQTLMQILYLIPPAVLLWRSFAAAGGAFRLLVPVLVMAAGQLAGGLAWITISGEDAPDLVAAAPVQARRVLRAKVEAVFGVVAVVFAPLVAALAILSPRHALAAGAGVGLAAASASAIQLWFRTQARRSQFRRRQVSSRVATFAEAFSSIGWAATAAAAVTNGWVALVSALVTLGMLAGARYLSPRP
jgi:ABC-2 type transport system permease protein